MVESLFVTTVVIAIVEFLHRLNNRDWEGAIIIVLAALVGGISGFFHIEGLVIQSGILAGLAAAGVVKVAQSFAGK